MLRERIRKDDTSLDVASFEAMLARGPVQLCYEPTGTGQRALAESRQVVGGTYVSMNFPTSFPSSDPSGRATIQSTRAATGKVYGWR